MTYTHSSDNFCAMAGLPAHVADVLEPELPAIADDILRAIAEEVPEYARPLEGAFGRAVRNGVERGAAALPGSVREADHPGPRPRRLRRPGARRVPPGTHPGRAAVRLPRRAPASRGGTLPTPARAPASSRRPSPGSPKRSSPTSTSSRPNRWRATRAPSPSSRANASACAPRWSRRCSAARPTAELGELAEQASWALPRTAATLACAADHMPGLARRLGADVMAAIVDGVGCVVVPDAEGPGRASAIRVPPAIGPWPSAPTVPVEQLTASWGLAAATLALRGVRATGPVSVDDHLRELLLFEGAPVIERMAGRRLAAFEPLTPKARARMEETALAYVRHAGSAVAMAAELHVHPQTARYRIARLRELLGDQLDDPDARFELEAALRPSVAWHPPAA